MLSLRPSLRPVVLLALVLLATTARADEVTIRPADVLDVVTADWNGDGSFDRAVLVRSSDPEVDTELFVYLSGGGDGAMALTVHRKGIVFAGAMWGTQPSLELTDRGSLLIKSGNEAIGRNRWQLTLTVAFRDGAFVVAGYTYSDRDTLDPDATTECDVNLLNGKGTLNGQPYSSPFKAKPLADWSDDDSMALCK